MSATVVSVEQNALICRNAYFWPASGNHVRQPFCCADYSQLQYTDQHLSNTKNILTHFARIFVSLCVILHVMPDITQSSKGLHLSESVLFNFEPILSFKNRTTAVYHRQIHKNVHRYISTLFLWENRHVTNSPQCWDMFVQLLACSYNYRPPQSTNIWSFSFTLMQYLPDPVTIDNRTFLPTDALTATAKKTLHDWLFLEMVKTSPKLFG